MPVRALIDGAAAECPSARTGSSTSKRRRSSDTVHRRRLVRRPSHPHLVNDTARLASRRPSRKHTIARADRRVRCRARSLIIDGTAHFRHDAPATEGSTTPSTNGPSCPHPQPRHARLLRPTRCRRRPPPSNAYVLWVTTLPASCTAASVPTAPQTSTSLAHRQTTAA